MTTTVFKGKISATFPARVNSVPPLVLTKSGDTYTFAIDTAFLEDLVPPFTYLGLSDTPDSFAGQANKLITVNPSETGLAFTTPATPASSGVVNIKDFGAIGDGVADDTAEIQAAIDYAFAHNIRTILGPDGVYKTSSPIYLDPPGNLRANLANPPFPTGNFAAALIGNEGLGNDTGDGFQIAPTFANDVALYVGPGNGMLVKNVSIRGPLPPGGLGYHRQRPTGGVGIGIAGGMSGSSRVRIENCWVDNFYTCYKTGANGNTNLGDSNTFIKCMAAFAAEGWRFSQTQNFINALYDCQITGCAVGVWSQLSTGCNINGGNWSGGDSAAHKWPCTLVASGGLTAINQGSYFTYRFTAKITSPTASDWQSAVANEIFDAFTFETTHFGIVPCTFVAYNSGTGVATFETTQAWSQYNWGSNNAQSISELELQLQAATAVFCCERMICFQGNNFSIDGIHIENPNGATTIIETQTGFGSNRPSVLKNVFCNFDPGLNNMRPAAGPTDENRCRYYCAKTFPFINVGNGDLTIENCMFGAGDVLLVDVQMPYRLTVRNAVSFWHNLRVWSQGSQFAMFDDSAVWWTADYDGCYFSGNFGLSYEAHWRVDRGGSGPFWGWRPAPYSNPAITPADLVVISGALPAISATTPPYVSYPIVWGGQPYSICKPYSPSGANYGKRFYSTHSFYSYGQNLPTINWLYRGQSFVVNCTDAAISMLFPGLGIKLTNAAAADILYVVTGVYAALGYFTVLNATSMPSQTLTSGVKTANVSGAVIKQEPYAITVT